MEEGHTQCRRWFLLAAIAKAMRIKRAHARTFTRERQFCDFVEIALSHFTLSIKLSQMPFRILRRSHCEDKYTKRYELNNRHNSACPQQIYLISLLAVRKIQFWINSEFKYSTIFAD